MWRRLASALAAMMLMLIAESAAEAPETPGTARQTQPLSTPVPYPPDYRTALADADRALATAQARATGNPGWLAEEMLARAHFEKAQLTGSVEAYAAAEQALARSLALAPPGTGPHLLQAAFDLSVHRLARAEAQLDRIETYAVPPSAGDQAEVEAMRGDIAFYRGRPEEALRHYDRADRASPGTTAFRRAYFHAARGDTDLGIQDIDMAERRSRRRSVQSAARAELQRGIFALEEGAVDRARTAFLRADALFPGHWLIEEHIAETLALTGRREEAESRYRDIVARTGAPEYMDALARLAREQGDPREARRWTLRAAAIWRQRLSLFPEAYYAQAAEHCLAGGDLPCAVRLARLNYRARPYGEAAALLGEALADAGREREARLLLEALNEARWRSARSRRLALRLSESG